ncbi:RnfABCDGE type electron transport complex subunit G [Bacteroides sp. 51]|uniref:RnfABCDGE type electron transport complex subunit G n=1 Tax=Bacteroides sp. 51 TaxID=2302938 RepID=UPI0013D4FF40|nr:RnfABCDGE type electron transport complex subunit G [Bacteroides sp. 51]NDV82903.1 RnfABCDGE type electron transport complex subunit G [Bacteroides sp. 51]
MKKLESSLKNMLLVLTGVTVVAVGLLAYVNELTKEPIAAANMKTLNDALKNVVPEFTNNPVAECDTIFEEKNGKKLVQFIVYPAKNGDQVVGTAVQSATLGFGGEIKVLVGFDAEGKIYDYALLSHAETPGLGSKADIWFKEGNKGSIVGMNPGESPLVVKNDGGQIDAITASTITTRAFLNAVNAAYGAYKGNPDAHTSASQQTKATATETDTNTAATQQAEDGTTAATSKVESTDSISAK